MRMMIILFVALLGLTACQATTYQDRGGAYRVGTPEQATAEAEVIADIRNGTVGFRCFPEGANPPGWEPDPRCPTDAPSAEKVASDVRQPLDATGGAIQGNNTPANNTIQQYGGEVVYTINIREGFNNELYQNTVQNKLLNFPQNTTNGAGLDTVNKAGRLAAEQWKQDPNQWIRNPLRAQTITIATFDRGTRRWRDEVWVNARRVAVCPVVEIKQFRLEITEGDPGIPLGRAYIRSECP